MTEASVQYLRNGVVLAELGGYGDGPYCAKHGAGAALVMMGTYIVDADDQVPYPQDFVFKPDGAAYASYLREHIPAARAGGAKVGVSVISVEMGHSMDFLANAEQAGADYASVCAHSVMEMFTKAELDQAHFVRCGSPQLERWAHTALAAVSIPVIFKIGMQAAEDTVAAVTTLARIGVPVVHINVGSTAPGSDGLRMVERLRGICQCLIVSGGIDDTQGARRVIAAGADGIAIGTAAMKTPTLCGRIQREIQHSP